MKWFRTYLSVVVGGGLVASGLYAIEPIKRRVPPVGIELPNQLRLSAEQRLLDLRTKFADVQQHPLAADAHILLKSAEFAVLHGEIYEPKHFRLLDETLSLAEERIAALGSGEPTWLHDQLTVRGFYSRIDGSPQPYGLVIPENLRTETPVPLYVWLHGRGDKTTDMHFIKERLGKVGQISPPDAIVLHPFGRQCIGFKSAGETDVLEAMDHVIANYNVDQSRIALMGFSMGGAGAWHLGAHYTDRFVAISPGAGFAETARYQRLSATQLAETPWYERQLWNQYDVPSYVRNLFNVPVICYSGENDKQIQAARVMEETFRQHDEQLDHVIGPGMGHQYDRSSLDEIMTKLDLAIKKGQSNEPTTVRFQTRTLRYSKMHWLQVDRLHKHWQDSTVDAELRNGTIWISTNNIAQLTIKPVPISARRLVIDDTAIQIGAVSKVVVSNPDGWRLGPLQSRWPLSKQPGLAGPIDDAFLERFIVVTPTRKSSNEQLNEWVEFELDHLRQRWSTLFRGTLPEKLATDLTQEDIHQSHLIVFGDQESNPIMRRAVELLPLQWSGGVQISEARFDGPQFVPAMVYPNPLSPTKYIVINSGPTFREAHDRTNSQQNPKLPDWAVFDISAPPNAEAAGRVVGAGFFDENWLP